MDKINSFGFWIRATDYMEAAQILFDSKGSKFRPTYLLLCQAMELCLKGYLRGTGLEIEYLKNRIGHNLIKALTKCEEKGLTNLIIINKHDRKAISIINEYYQGKDLVYTAFGIKDFPNIKALFDMVGKVLRVTQQFCLEHKHEHDGKISAARQRS